MIIKPISEKIILANYEMKNKFLTHETTVFSIRLNVELLELINDFSSEINISKNQLINCVMYQFLKDENLLKIKSCDSKMNVEDK